MFRIWRVTHKSLLKMANLPPRKITTAHKVSKQDTSPLQILLQMGFPRHRALKALAATGNRSVQLASDWLLTHVSDAFLDSNEPREYVFYASPTGVLLGQLLEFWEKSKLTCGWNGAHSYPPHITLVSFFKAPDETSMQLAKAVKQVVESVGQPPSCPLKLEPYVSQNFMGLFVSEEHADYLKRIAVQYVKQVSSVSVNLEAHVKSLHITLAYHFDVAAYEGLKALVEELQPVDTSSWELRLYSRDPRFANHQVYKVTQGYVPKACDELELVLGDYIYIDEKEFQNSPDGWVYGTSWLTGVSGFLPAVYTQRTAESDAWTLHRAISLNNTDSKSESDSSTDGEMSTSYPHEDASGLGLEKSEEHYKEWKNYWQVVAKNGASGIMSIQDGDNFGWKSNVDAVSSSKSISNGSLSPSRQSNRRWFFALRHGERVDLTYGQWVPYCFDKDGNYVRKDLNLPLTLPQRAGGKEAFEKDTPLTRVGRLQAQLVGEGLRLANVPIKHVYTSAALRCVETAQEMLNGLQAEPSVKIRVEPGLFEYLLWHKGLMSFMTPLELHKAGYNVDLNYKPYIDLDIQSSETIEEYYKRNEKVMTSVVRETEAEGGNVIFVGHAATLDMMAIALKRMGDNNTTHPPYQVSSYLNRVPYCALASVRDKPWELVSPPCPPCINSSSGRFDWKILLDLK